MSNVTPLGCMTENWRQRVRVTRRVEREIRRDPSLVPVLHRALDEHGGKLHRVLGRDGFVHTVAYLRRAQPNGCVIATHCTPDLILGTVVDFARVVHPR